MSYSDILQLSFGKSRAESEKEWLDEYFVTTNAYLNAKSERDRKLYYIGHRGAGKSALLNQLATEYRRKGDNIILSIGPTQFSYELFEKRKHEFYDVKTVYGAVWHYTLIVKLFKKTVRCFEENRHKKRNRKEVDHIKKYLIDEGFLEAESMLNVFVKYLKKITVGRFEAGGAGMEIRTADADEELIRFLNLSDISKEIYYLKKISVNHPMYIFIDELDTGWNDTREARNFIHGLFYAVEEMREMENVNIFVSLRSDMYNNLSSVLPDAEKMRDDIQRFTWNKKTLRGLIGRRIVAHWPNNELENSNSKEAISRVFEDGAFDYILSRCLNRPREVIQFCNDVLDEYRNTARMQGTTPPKIPKSIVKSVEPKFSSYRFNDLCEEHNDQYPALKKLLIQFENDPKYYSYSEFNQKLEDSLLSVSLDGLQYSWINKYMDNIPGLINLLFDIGFIEVYSERHDGYMAYYDTSLLGVSNINYIRIHNAFTSTLKCHDNS